MRLGTFVLVLILYLDRVGGFLEGERWGTIRLDGQGWLRLMNRQEVGILTQ